MAKAQAKGVKIHLPIDFVCADKVDKAANIKHCDIESGIPDGWLGLDAYEKSIEINRAAV
jgi:phosphoglycerate kinase